MDLKWLIPRQGTQEHRNLLQLVFALFAVAVAVIIPDLAIAAGFDGKFEPNSTTVSNTGNSFAAWWRAAVIPGMWVSAFFFLFSIFVMQGKLWGVPVGAALLFMFGEMLVNGVKTFVTGSGTTTGAIDTAYSIAKHLA